MPGVIVVGAQWGDEGKGKIIDILTTEAKHIVRAQGGNNAGHTIIIGQEEYKLHLTPSGILHPHTQCYIGAGTVIDPEVLILEMNKLESRGIDLTGRLWISPAAHIIFPFHRKLDLLLEQRKGLRAVGTTGRGIGPCYADKANRLGIRMAEMLNPELFPKLLETVLKLKNEELTKLYNSEPLSYEEICSEYTRYAQYLNPHIASVEEIIDNAVVAGENVLFEGAQGTFLDTTTGTYPYVTSSNTVAGGICTGAGIGPSRITHTLGVIKAYTTRVGLGPLPSEVEEGEEFLDHQAAREFGTTTRRKRRIGWFDAVLAKTAAKLNGLDSLALTKLDILDQVETIKLCVAYDICGERVSRLPYLAEDLQKTKPIYEEMPGWKTTTTSMSTFEELPIEAQNYLKRIETLTEVPISIISVGPERDQTIVLNNPFAVEELAR
ncbi:MAG: Adenylosuccinate synthetase [Chlamydiae bacterium]|nr:Adenylosuccinate synthetase [Chlamydiota bacterium]